ncbi:HAD family hydrolase [Streptococcus castoreus]|uniref:HAD family hydrolase n=1 Tax=Streptococcus castoreus TaxID=254786 RepID=UPI00041A819C|nr:HAD family phosphatase [Streptococcus castoreus]
MIKGIIFDMDGVLFDTEPFYFKRRDMFLRAKGITIENLSPKDFIGGNLQEIWKDLLANHFSPDQVKVVAADYEAYKLDHKPPYQELIFSEVKPCLEALRKRGIKLALASNSSQTDILLALDSSQMSPFFDVILAREDVTHGKPHPEIYDKAAQQLGIPKDELLVVEDSQKGIAAAKASGMTVLAITDYRYGIDQSQADQHLDHLAQLCAIVEQL